MKNFPSAIKKTSKTFSNTPSITVKYGRFINSKQSVLYSDISWFFDIQQKLNVSLSTYKKFEVRHYFLIILYNNLIELKISSSGHSKRPFSWPKFMTIFIKDILKSWLSKFQRPRSFLTIFSLRHLFHELKNGSRGIFNCLIILVTIIIFNVLFNLKRFMMIKKSKPTQK